MKRMAGVLSILLVGSFTMLGCVGAEDPVDDFEDPDLEGVVDGDGDEDGAVSEEIGDAASDALGASEKPGGESEDLVAWCNDILSWNASWTELENQVLTLVNQKRAAGATCGGTYYPPVPALTFDERLRCASRKHSKDMGVNNFFSHTGSNGSSPWQRMNNAGYTWTAAAENIAAGYSTASAVVNGWMASSGHCKNIMKSNVQHLGTGYYYSATSTYKHYWTQDFGKP